MSSKYIFALGSHLLCTALFIKLWNFIFPELTSCFYYFVSSCILWACIAAYTFKFIKRKFLNEKVHSENRAVFVTGCDSGFGNLIAKRLDSKGFHVFATCLSPSGPGATELKKSCSQRLHILHMDVTQDDSVKKALEFVKDNLGTCELWTIVNNAGIQKGFSVDFSDIKDFKDCLNVNALGPVRVTKAFLPLLKQSKGRIVNTTSMVGEFAIPMAAPYITSKFAASGFAECLRQELAMWGITVITIEPEVFRTGLTDKAVYDRNLEAAFDSLESTLKDGYGEKYLESFKNYTDWVLSLASPRITVVVDDIVSAVTLVYPNYIYKPRRNSFVRFLLFCYLLMPKTWQFLITKLFITVMFAKPKNVINN